MVVMHSIVEVIVEQCHTDARTNELQVNEHGQIEQFNEVASDQIPIMIGRWSYGEQSGQVNHHHHEHSVMNDQLQCFHRVHGGQPSRVASLRGPTPLVRQVGERLVGSDDLTDVVQGSVNNKL